MIWVKFSLSIQLGLYRSSCTCCVCRTNVRYTKHLVPFCPTKTNFVFICVPPSSKTIVKTYTSDHYKRARLNRYSYYNYINHLPTHIHRRKLTHVFPLGYLLQKARQAIVKSSNLISFFASSALVNQNSILKLFEILKNKFSHVVWSR